MIPGNTLKSDMILCEDDKSKDENEWRSGGGWKAKTGGSGMFYNGLYPRIV
jgi:hypothetical protein